MSVESKSFLKNAKSRDTAPFKIIHEGYVWHHVGKYVHLHNYLYPVELSRKQANDVSNLQIFFVSKLFQVFCFIFTLQN